METKRPYILFESLKEYFVNHTANFSVKLLFVLVVDVAKGVDTKL